MPIISQFYGIFIKMFYNDKDKHHREHIHAQYCEFQGVFDFEGNLIKRLYAKETNKTNTSMDRNSQCRIKTTLGINTKRRRIF